MNKLQSVDMPNTFQCICDYWQGKFWQIAHNSPNLPIFLPHQNFPVYGYQNHLLSTSCVIIAGKTKLNQQSHNRRVSVYVHT